MTAVTAVSSRLLIVDDDDALRSTLASALTLEGYLVDTAEDGLRAVALLAEGLAPDVVVLDLLMPRLDGVGTCRMIRRHSDVPILMLTARAETADRVAGLDSGADDYLGKPFAFAELLARLRALLRRVSTEVDVRRFADVEVDVPSRSVTRGTRAIELTRIEFALLELFLQNPGRALDRGTIFVHVWGPDIENASNSVDVFIRILRGKLEQDGEPRLIHTVRGIGYVLREPD